MHVTNNGIAVLHRQKDMHCVEAYIVILSVPVHTWTHLSGVYASGDYLLACTQRYFLMRRTLWLQLQSSRRAGTGLLSLKRM